MNNVEIGKGLVKSVGAPPNGGCYGDPDFWAAYLELVKAVGELIPSDRSYGALGLQGVGAKARARCKAIVAKAKVMEDIMKAVTHGR